jgi:hypothetical protein
MPAEVTVTTETQTASVSAIVIRCGCGDPDSHNGVNGPPQACPRPRRTDDLGVVSYYSRNPMKRLAWALVGAPLAALRIHRTNRS